MTCEYNSRPAISYCRYSISLRQYDTANRGLISGPALYNQVTPFQVEQRKVREYVVLIFHSEPSLRERLERYSAKKANTHWHWPFNRFAFTQLLYGKTSSAGQIRTDDLEVMSLASYRAAPPRVISKYYTHLCLIG